MAEKERKETDEEEAATRGPRDFADLCQRMMSGKTRGGCGSRMQEMMSRCMASFGGGQEEPGQSREEGGDDEDQRRTI